MRRALSIVLLLASAKIQCAQAAQVQEVACAVDGCRDTFQDSLYCISQNVSRSWCGFCPPTVERVVAQVNNWHTDAGMVVRYVVYTQNEKSNNHMHLVGFAARNALIAEMCRRFRLRVSHAKEHDVAWWHYAKECNRYAAAETIASTLAEWLPNREEPHIKAAVETFVQKNGTATIHCNEDTPCGVGRRLLKVCGEGEQVRTALMTALHATLGHYHEKEE